jgi:hypothetical protein
MYDSSGTTKVIPGSELGNWERVGRGRVLQFFATDEEVQAWLNSALPPAYAPYGLIRQEYRIRGQRRLPIVTYSVSDFIDCLGKRDPPSTHFHIWSEVLSFDLLGDPCDDVGALCSLNGLPAVDHGHVRKGKQEGSAISIVDRVRNKTTGELRDHSEYRKVYNSLVRVIKKSLCYSTINRFADGSEREDTSLRRMTEAAAQAHGHAVVFSARPGRRLDDRS